MTTEVGAGELTMAPQTATDRDGTELYYDDDVQYLGVATGLAAGHLRITSIIDRNGKLYVGFPNGLLVRASDVRLIQN